MPTAPAMLALVATLALGVVVGLFHLQRARRPRLVTAHLALALLATALVAATVVSAPGRMGGPHPALPLGLLAVSLAAGWGAFRVIRGSRRGSELVLAAHAVIGVAGFLVFLAWAGAAGS